MGCAWSTRSKSLDVAARSLAGALIPPQISVGVAKYRVSYRIRMTSADCAECSPHSNKKIAKGSWTSGSIQVSLNFIWRRFLRLHHSQLDCTSVENPAEPLDVISPQTVPISLTGEVGFTSSVPCSGTAQWCGDVFMHDNPAVCPFLEHHRPSPVQM